MIGSAVRGVGYALTGFRLITRSGVRRYVAIPLLINVLLFGGVIWYGYTEFETLLNQLLPTWLGWVRWILWPLFAITILLVVFFTFTLIANLIGAPFNALLAEKIETALTGEKLPETKGAGALALNIGGAVSNEVRKLLYLVLWTIPLLLLFIIPTINVAAPILWMIFSAWMLALEYSDYPMGNHNMKFREERRLLRNNRGLALGFGGTLMLMTATPVLNFLVMPVGVAGATTMWVEHLRSRRLSENG